MAARDVIPNLSTMATQSLIPDPAVEPTISVHRAAQVLGVSPRSLYLACHRGEEPHTKVGQSIRILTARFLEQHGFTAAAA